MDTIPDILQPSLQQQALLFPWVYARVLPAHHLRPLPVFFGDPRKVIHAGSYVLHREADTSGSFSSWATHWCLSPGEGLNPWRIVEVLPGSILSFFPGNVGGRDSLLCGVWSLWIWAQPGAFVLWNLSRPLGVGKTGLLRLSLQRSGFEPAF